MEEGKRFSQIYLERGAPLRDSVRFRNRLSAYFYQHLTSNHTAKVAPVIEAETGAKIRRIGAYIDIPWFFESNELRDILDSITLIYRVINDAGYRTDAANWKNFVARTLREENLGYRLDSKCGVHYFIDEEFERNRVSTLSILHDLKYAGVRDAYEAAYRHMDSDPPDTKATVRSMFESLEILVRQMVPATKNLNRWIVENTLKEKCIKIYESEPTAARVVAGLFDGFADWVDALHNYRHGQPSGQPVAPSEEVAVYVLSTGSAFLRWLIGINTEPPSNHG
jgi:hypothetical protein